MARTDNVLCNLRREIAETLAYKYPTKVIKAFFGIDIKKVDEKEDLYNMYMNGKLVLPKVHEWDIEYVLTDMATQFKYRLCKESAKEDNLKETEKMRAKLEDEEIENEQENYYICPICHLLTSKNSIHFHTHHP